MINNDTISHLLSKARQEDGERAFDRFFKVCFPDLLRFAFSLIHSHVLSEEIVSDVLLNIWKKRDSSEKIKDVKLYLYVSVRNRVFSELRKNTPPISSLSANITLWTKASSSNPEEDLMTKELREALNQAIDNLPPRCGLIYKLIREDGLKYREVAELLGIAQKTVEAQMGIAMKRLHLAVRQYNKMPLSQKNYK